MAVTDTRNTGIDSMKQFKDEVHYLAFTSTTNTVEVTTDLSEIVNYSYARVGGTDEDDRGLLTLDETVTNGIHAVTSGAITFDRDSATAAGTLTTEAFILTLYGR